jgi:membrane-bound ClpP family serine protease
MPQYRVKAIHRTSGKEGFINLEARDENDARNQIADDGYLVETVELIPTQQKIQPVIKQSKRKTKTYSLGWGDAILMAVFLIIGALMIFNGILAEGEAVSIMHQIYSALYIVGGFVMFGVILLIRIASALIHIAKNTPGE